MKKVFSSNQAPAAIGPYSQVVTANGFYFLSGQLGINPETGKMATDEVEGQTEQIFKNIRSVLAAAGLTMDNVLKVTVFLTDMGDFAKVNEIYAKQFSEPFPARSAFAVKALPAGGLVEIEVIAAE